MAPSAVPYYDRWGRRYRPGWGYFQSMRFADRTRRLATRTFFADVEARLEAGLDLINFAYGEPDQPTPDEVAQATHAALERGETKYAATMGLGDLRRQVARHVSGTRRVAVAEDEVLVLPGANPAFLLALLALVDEGDEVILPNPGYPIYWAAAEFVGATPVPLPLRPETDFAFDPRELESLVTPRTRAVFVNSPGNPTGNCLSPGHLGALAEVAERHDLWVVSDEVYSAFTYEGGFGSVITIPGMRERTLLVDSLSKTFAMTGWRLGWATGPRALIDILGGLMGLGDSCVNTFVQRGAAAALAGYGRQAAFMRDLYRTRRDQALAQLLEIPGVRCTRPAGAFYLFPEVGGACARLGLAGARELQGRLVGETGVAVLARDCFGPPNPGERGEYVRLAYTLPSAETAEGLARFRAMVEGRQQPKRGVS